LSRRRFLNLVGRAGGAKAAYNTMAAMGLLPAPTAYAGPPDLAPYSGNGVRVVVLGAGIAGMTAAYELSKAGYACTVIEGRRRPGGRNWTIRGGDKVEESDAVQRCSFDAGEHMYFNAGPARIPHHHKAILGYCKDFGVALEVIVNDNRATYLHSDGAFEGRPLPNRQVIHDSRGFVAELLAKAISKDALADDVSVEDKDRLLAFVRSFGALTKDYFYKGSPRAGYEDPPGAGLSQGRLREPLSFKELLKSDFWEYKLYYSERFEQAATMLQPVGGMDRIAQAFARRLGETIKYDCAAKEIRKTANGARVIYQDGTRVQVSHRCLRLCEGGKDCISSRSSLLGRGSSNLRRHFLDQSRHHPDLVSFRWLSPSQGSLARRLYLDQSDRRAVRAPNPRAAARGGRDQRREYPSWLSLAGVTRRFSLLAQDSLQPRSLG